MTTKASAFCLLIYLLTSVFFASAQSITPSTLNMGGGSYESSAYQFDWSIGDGISIETFLSDRNLIVTSGVLQPFTEKSGVPDYFTHPWAKDELAVFPIPAYNTLDLDVKIAEKGLITAQVFDQRGRIIFTSRYNFDGTNNIQKVVLTGLRPGVYYLKVSMGGVGASPMIRKSSFKIQKL
jgi:hypothetical protein